MSLDGSQHETTPRILVVDDDPGTARLLRSWYEGRPFVILEASDGIKGIELALAERPDVIVLDVLMPGMDGLTVATRLKSESSTQNIPVIMLTAQRATENKIEGLDSGANDYVTKPFEVEEIDARIRRSLNERELQRQLERANKELASKNRLLNELAVVDEKTGLFNYRHFKNELDQEWLRSERYGTPLSLVMLDLDDFKRLNDTLGHQAGDQALKEFATLVTGGARATDIAARYGGEEFVVVLPHTRGEMARNVAERIREAARQFVFAESFSPTRMTVSAGVATYPAEGIDSADSLIGMADAALYRAKESGKDRVIVAGEDKAGPKSSALRRLRKKPSPASGAS